MLHLPAFNACRALVSLCLGRSCDRKHILSSNLPFLDSSHLVLLSQADSDTKGVLSQRSCSFIAKAFVFLLGRFVLVIYEEGWEATGNLYANPLKQTEKPNTARL